MLRIILIAAALLTMTAGCSKERDDLRSPCVGAEGSPCGPTRNVNAWWMA